MNRKGRPEIDNRIGRRGSGRLRARIPARLVTLDGTRSTVLIDLSTGGARAKAVEGLRVGQQMVLQWAGFEAYGAVQWLAHGLCGMAFDEPIESEVLLETRAVDEREHLPEDRDLVRLKAWEWVSGARRV
ncbi:MAG: PilZ domain-containing protein [Novosphingobium sp.]